MDLVQSLKKTLNSWVDKILVATSFHYIKHLAKQTTKKQDNSLSTESLQNPLTQESPSTTIATSSQGISEKIIMETEIEPVAQIREWAIDRLGSVESVGAKSAIYEEFEDWIELEDKDEIEYMCLEDLGEFNDP